MKKILVIGSLNMDIVADVKHMPKPGETILCDRVEMIPGGKGANQACAAGKLGADVTMFGAVGDDTYADMQLESLKKAGVNTERILKRKNVSTGLAMITVDENGENMIVVAPGANNTLREKDIEDNIDLIENTDIVIFQLEIPLETVFFAAKKAKELGKIVILDPAPVPECSLEMLYPYVDVIKPNETEMRMLAGSENVNERIEMSSGRLREKGIKNVIVTLGERGVYVDTEEGASYVPALNVEAVDTTAAGDSFVAAMTLMLAEGKAIGEAVKFANIVSAIVVTRKGAQSSIPWKNEVMCEKIK